MALSFDEWYKKKKKEEETKTFDEWYGEKYGKVTESETNSALEWRNDEIAPVSYGNSTKGGNKNSIFKSGGFSDGVDGIGDFFGDLGETVLGTVGDLGLSVAKGAGRLVEGLVDLGMYGIAGAADLLGADDDDVEAIKEGARTSYIDKWTQGAVDYVDQYSALGNKADMVGEGLGQVASIILTGGLGAASGLGTVGTTALTTGVMGLSGVGSGMGEAYTGGATDEEAWKYGLTKGAIEAGSELLFGGLGKASKAIGIGKSAIPLDDLLARAATKKITSQTAKNLVQYGIKASAEGVEEVVAGYLTAHAKKGIYMPEKDFSEILDDENLLESFIVGAVTSGIAQSGLVPSMKRGSLIEANKEGRDFITGYTQSEQSVIDKEVENRIAEQEKGGKKLTKKEIAKIEELVQQDMEKGRISTDTIEETLGGETYKQYKSASDQRESLVNKKAELQKELQELKKAPNTIGNAKLYDSIEADIKDIDAKIKNLDKYPVISNLKKQLVKETLARVKDSRLIESYNEVARKGKKIEIDLNQYKNEYAKKTAENAIRFGLNDTNEAHDFLDLATRLAEDKNYEVNFVTTQGIKESVKNGNPYGIDADPEKIQAFVSEKRRQILVNMDTKKSLNSLVGHEITDTFRETDGYEKLQKFAFAYAETKGEYKNRLDSVKRRYANLNADIKGELTSDIVGDYLFSDYDFVKQLSVEHRNIFQKIYDEIKYMYNLATAGSKEARELEKLKHQFKKVWKESSVKGGNGVNYSIAVEDKKTLDFLNKQKESGEVTKVYRAMQVQPVDENGNVIKAAVLRVASYSPLMVEAKTFGKNGKVAIYPAKLFSPMAGMVNGKWSNSIELNKWEETTFDLANATTVIDKKTGKPKIDNDKKNASYGETAYYYGLVKGGIDDEGKKLTDVPARYNPYIHTSLSALNDQFSSANKRPELVTVECIIPNSELTSGFRAEGAKDRVGAMSWHSGPTSSRLAKVGKARTVILTRYDMPVRVLPDSEVAKAVAQYIGDTENIAIQGSTVTPSLSRELMNLGVSVLNEEQWSKYSNDFPVKAFGKKKNSGKVKYSISEDSNGNELSPAVQKRFANSKAVDENGNLKVLYHGTANGEFYTFDKAKGNVEGDFGSGFYFTDNESDVESNYEGGGPDFENKVARRAEQIETDEEIDYHEAEKRAREELYKGSNKHTVYLNIENPAIVGETNLFDYESYAEEYDREDYDSDEDYEGDVEQLIADDIDKIIWDVDRNVDVYSTDGLAEVLWNAVNYGGIDIEQLKANINNLYLEDSNGNLVGNEVTRQIIESLGYDGIIDNTVSSKFNMNLEEGTTHYIVFKPNQIKSIDNQNPTDNADIRYSLSDNKLDNGQDLTYNGIRGENYVRTDEFRNLQTECQGMSDEDIQLYHSGSKQIDEGLRERFSRGIKSIFLESENNGISYDKGILNLTAKNNNFNMHEGVNGSLFHDVFEMARNHLKYGELVDLHEIETTEDGIGYNDCYNYLSEDGLSGFSITPEGDLISVFNASGKKGFLRAIAPIVKEKAKTLDCYASENQNLMEIYSAIFGFKSASVMDYNMEYDHDNIAENHGMPQIAFMVNSESDVATRQFTKDEYDEAVTYRNSFVNQAAQNEAASFMPEDIAPTDVKYSISEDSEGIAPIGDYGYHAGDLGKAEGYWNMTSSNRSTGHFGTGTYFVGDEAQISDEHYYGKRPHEKVDFSNYNLYKPLLESYGFELHDQLKYINNNISNYPVASMSYDEIWDVCRKVEQAESTLYWEDNATETDKAEAKKTLDEMKERFEGIGYDPENWGVDTLKEELLELRSNYQLSKMRLDSLFGWIGEEKINSALESVYNEVSQIEDSYDARYEDSPSTRFMKAMGYEGIDVRGFKGLDNTTYGSVIYDLKGDDLARKKEIGTAKYSLSEQGESFKEYGNFNVYADDIKLQDIAPTRMDIPKAETANVAPTVEENATVDAPMQSEAEETVDDAPMLENIPVLPDEQLEQGTHTAIKPKPTKQPSLKKVEGVENTPNIAKVMTEAPKVEKKKGGILSKAIANFVDKGAVFENLSLKTKNRALQDTYKAIGRSESKAQYFMENGTKGVKSLDAIRTEVEKTGHTAAFYEYLYHKHNVDRMSLESKEQPNLQRLTGEMEKLKLLNLQENQLRAIASEKITKETSPKREHLIKTVREYLASLDVKNKPVFGFSVTAEMSQKIVDEYESLRPDFKEYAQDVYDYMNYLRKMMVYNGIISQETAELWSEMYPNYVPIHRVGDEGLGVNVPLDTNRTGINAPIKRATGGNTDILPLFDTMAQRTMQTFKAIDKNNFGIELKDTLGGTIESTKTSLDDVIDSIDAQDGLLQEGKNGKNPTFTVFEGGDRVTFEITDEMYDALKPTSEGLSTIVKPLNAVSNFHRRVLTEYNPTFMVTNAIKDAQDVLINSQHPAKTYANFPLAIKELTTNGKWFAEYMQNGGGDNTYFDKQTNTFNKEKSTLRKVIGFPFDKISDANNFIEKIPRLAEYIASRKNGASIDGAMLDAARVTTDFSAGGDITKFLNRNGATFLNASVQGFAQQVRNVREAKMNGLKGWVQLATKYAIAGLPAILLNSLLWDDDEDYEELSDYVKDNYYVVAKYGDGKFVRIPKGRASAVIQDGIEQIGNTLTGNPDTDWNNFFELFMSNLAPNNPLDNNIIAPIKQVMENKTWYGEDLVPTRLQDLPASEQFDESTDSISKWLGESTDSISKWLGESLNVSPYKINYLLNQYSGGIGDVVLPMLTPEAESGDNSLLGNVLAPMKDKFTTDSVMNNQNVSDFYTTKDELAINANGSNATDEDVLKYKYFNSANAELSKLYKLKREVQNSDLPDDRKYEKVRDIQDEINATARESLNSYNDVYVEDGYAVVGDKEFKLNKSGEWQKITDEQAEKQADVSEELGISASDYWSDKSEYDFAYKYPNKYAVAKAVGGYDSYKSYSSELYDIKADKDASGKSISGSRKEKVVAYINNLDADYYEKIILFKSEYPSSDTYNGEIIEYINNREDLSYDEKVKIFTELGFTVQNGSVYWD